MGSGGGNKPNVTLNLGAIPNRWMAHEAMLAGLELKPLGREWTWTEIKASQGRNSMNWFYAIAEYTPLINWLDDSKDPPNSTRCNRLPVCGKSLNSAVEIYTVRMGVIYILIRKFMLLSHSFLIMLTPPLPMLIP